jgi:hypothetical protein
MKNRYLHFICWAVALAVWPVAAHAGAILWDISSSASGNVDATAADFMSAGVAEDLDGASVSHVVGLTDSTMSDANGVTLSYMTEGQAAKGLYVNSATMVGAGSAITQEYLALKNSAGNLGPIDMQIGGLSALLEPDTEYSLYIWGCGDNADQGSSFTFEGTTIEAAQTDPDANSASHYLAQFSFTTDATVADTLDFTWTRINTYAGFNGFAIVAYTEPVVPTPKAFVHPGITHKRSDLDRMKAMVEAQIDPWYSSYQEMISDDKASYDYEVQGDESFTLLERDSPRTNYGAWNSDIRAAYYNAIRWYISGDSRHADKAIEIFNAWTNLTSVTSGGTDSLSGGVGYIMVEAAELIKSTYDGWPEDEIQAFKDMLVYPGYSTTAIPSGDTTFYWMSYQGDPGRHGNQGLSGWRTVMAMGIFMDNEIMYDRALRYIQGLPHRDDDLAYPSGPRVATTLSSEGEFADTYNTTTYSTTADYGYNELMTNYIYANGQCQESSRDHQHTAFGIGLLTSMSEMAWNQGDDLYGHEDDRLLLGLEYNMRYNVSTVQTFSDQETPWVPTVASGEFLEGFDRTCRWYSKAISTDGAGEIFSGQRPVFEMPLAHYYGRGLKTAEEVKWLWRARDLAIDESGYEVAGWSNDAIGWGGLSARRPAYCYGDPIRGFTTSNVPDYAMNQLPGTIEAENYDYFTISGEGRTYHDLSATNSGQVYRSEDVDIAVCSEGGYALTDLEDGEWVTYTVSVPATGTYDLSIRYAASASGGKISCSVGGTDVTGEVAVPASSGEWQDLTLASGVVLSHGVQSLKVTFNGTPAAFELSALTVARDANALAGHWTFDDGAGTSVEDSSGFENHGTAVNPVWVTDQLGGALDFNGTDASVSLPAAVFNSISDEITIALWAYGGDLQPQDDSIFYAVDSSGNRTVNIHLPWSNSGVYWDAGYDGGYDRIDKTASENQFMGQWNHWAFTKNAATGTMKIFLNGELWHSGTGKTKTIGGITQVRVGAQTSGAYYDGMIGDLKLFSVALTDDEISELYQSGDAHAPVFDASLTVSNGNLYAEFFGTVGQHYQLESTSSLTNSESWQVVTDIDSLETSPFPLSVPVTNNHRFYRLLWLSE